MSDIYLTADGNTIVLQPGETPPPGAQRIQAQTAAAPTSVDLTAATGGVPADAFATYATQQNVLNTKNITIPIFRGQNTTPRNVRRVTGPGGDETIQSIQVNATPQQYKEADAYTQFGTILADPGLFKQWSDTAVKTGLVSPAEAQDVVKLQQAWYRAVRWAIDMKAASPSQSFDVTPFEAASLAAQNSGAEMLAQSANPLFTGTRTQTQTVVDTKQSQSADDALRKMLGRAPTAGERAAYQHGLNNIAEANPTTSTRNMTYKDGKLVADNITNTGGYDQSAAEQQAAASASPQVAMTQQATTYYDALVKALGAAV